MNNMKTFKDSDLRKAIQRKYADTPPIPAEFKERFLIRILKE